MLNREQFCRLTGISTVEVLKSRAKRYQLPIAADSAVRKSYGYSWFDVFVTILADRLATGPICAAPSAASSIVRDIGPALAARWCDILRSGQRVVAGVEDQEIEFLALFTTTGTNFAIGTRKEIAKFLTKLPDATSQNKLFTVDMVGGNVSRAAAVMLLNARKSGISVSDEAWTETPSFLPGEFVSVTDQWAQAVARANAGASARALTDDSQTSKATKTSKAPQRKGARRK